MKCQYCQEECEPGLRKTSFPFCSGCSVSYEIDYEDNIQGVMFMSGYYSVELEYRMEKTFLYDSSFNIMLRLPYLADINPKNYLDWIQRLVNLKAFS